MRNTTTPFVPAHKQTNPEHAPGQQVHPLGFKIQPSEKTLAEYIERTHKQEAANTECCGNPLRGCVKCPPQKKLTFDECVIFSEILAIAGNEQHEREGFIEALRAFWQAAQENK